MSRPLRIAPLALAVLLGGCGESGPPPADAPDASAATQAAAPAAPVPVEAPAVAAPAVTAVDACSLLSQEEVEAAGGRKALAPRGEQAAELSTCAWGDPDAPKMGDRPLGDVVELSAFSGSNAYFAGPAEQAREIYRMGRGNTPIDEPVAGLGEDAYWDGSELHVLRAPYAIDVKLDPVSREAAETLARAALGRLP